MAVDNSYILKWLSAIEMPPRGFAVSPHYRANETTALILEHDALEDMPGEVQNEASHEMVEQQQFLGQQGNPLQSSGSEQVDSDLNASSARSPDAILYSMTGAHHYEENNMASAFHHKFLGAEEKSMQQGRFVRSHADIGRHSPIMREEQGLRTANTKRRRIVEKNYGRKPRAKTRPDRYQPKATIIPQRATSASDPKNKKPKKRKHTLISEYFNAANVTTDRLTVPSSHRMGIFGNGRTSTPVKSRDLPDLTFSEMKFLRKQGDKNEQRSLQAMDERYVQTSPRKRSYRNMPQYISLSDSPVDRGTVRQKLCKRSGHGAHCREAPSGIHLPQMMTSPVSRNSKLTKRRDYSLLPPNKMTNESTKPCHKMPIDPPSGGICPYIDSEGRAHSRELDPSLLTYVTAILLNKPSSRNDGRSEVAEDKKPYYNLEDLKKLCKDRERLQNLQDGVSSARRSVADSHKQRQSYTRSTHHSRNKGSMHSNHSEIPLRGPSRSRSSHKVSTNLYVHADSASRVVLPKKVVEASPRSRSGNELPIGHFNQNPAYDDYHLNAQRVRGGQIEKSDEGFGQTTGSLDLQTEYAISESIPSVSEVMLNLYGDSYIEELRDIETNEIFDKHELPDEVPGSLALHRESDAAVQHEAHGNFLSDMPLAWPMLNSTFHVSTIARDPRLPMVQGISRPYTSQLPTWDSYVQPAAGKSHQSHHIQDLSTQTSVLREETRYSTAFDYRPEGDYGPPAFWRQNRLY